MPDASYRRRIAASKAGLDADLAALASANASLDVDGFAALARRKLNCAVTVEHAGILLADAARTAAHAATGVAREEDRALVVAYLHHAGEHHAVLDEDGVWAVYCEGDGFGYLSPDELSGINDGWDWSHVRDSTPEGWARMACWLREHGYGPDGPSSRPGPA